MYSNYENEQSGGGFLDVLKWLFIALLIAIVASGIFFLFFYLVAYNFLNNICRSSIIYTIIAILGVVLEIGGLIGSIFAGAGIPFVGIGMFLEILTIMCDFMRGEPGWEIDVLLGIFGLIPIVGLIGTGSKYIRKLFRLL